MWSIKNVIRSQKKLADGTNAVFLRLTIDGKVAYMATGIRVNKNNWNNKTGLIKTHVPYSDKDNAYLSSLKRKLQDIMIAEGSATMSPSMILKMLNDKPSDFYGYADRFLRIRESKGQYATIEIYKDHINQMRSFAPKLTIADINDDFVNRFILHLRKTNNSQTIYRKIKFFSGIIKLAIKDNLINYNAFDENNISPGRTKIKDIPTIDDIKSLISVLPQLSDVTRLGVHMFLCQFFTRGTRISDIILLRRDQIHDDKITFVEQKTAEPKRVNITEVLREIIDQYHHPIYVFPMCRWIYDKKLDQKTNEINKRREISTATSKVNKALKKATLMAGINKNLTTHTSRHGFATMAIQSLGDIRKVQGLINHKKYQTTEGYIQDLNRSDYSEEEKLIYKKI